MGEDQLPIPCEEHPSLSLGNPTILGGQKLANAASSGAARELVWMPNSAERLEFSSFRGR